MPASRMPPRPVSPTGCLDLWTAEGVTPPKGLAGGVLRPATYHGQSLAQREQVDERSVHTRRLAASELHGVRVLLLRHDGGARGHRVAGDHKLELLRRPQHPLFGDARRVHGDDGQVRHVLNQKVAIRHSIQLRLAPPPLPRQRSRPKRQRIKIRGTIQPGPTQTLQTRRVAFPPQAERCSDRWTGRGR